jgi:hypothetical protein
MNLDIPSCIQTTEGVVPKIGEMRALIADQLPRFPLQLFDELEDRALALGHAHTVYESAHEPPPELQALSDEGRTLRDVALSEVTTQVKRKRIPASALSKLNGGNGYENLAADLFKLAEIMRSQWDKLSSHTTMTLSELDHMENIGDDIRKALGIREQMPALQAATGCDRQASYTLFIEAYDEVRAALDYVRRKDGDLDELMPSLYAGRNGGMKKKVTPEVPANPAAAPSTTAENHSPAVVTPAPTPATTTSATATPPANTGANAANTVSPAVLDHGPFVH